MEYLDFINWEFVSRCYYLSVTTSMALIFLEWLSWNEKHVENMKRKEVAALYNQAVFANLFHYTVLGPIAYGLAMWCVESLGQTNDWKIAFPGVVLVQGVGYASMHAFMHKKENYWMHKYHHQYSEKTFVRPIASNAVSTAEFVFAYALPLVVGIILFRPSEEVIYWVTTLVSLTNLLIHTPQDTINQSWMPSFMVTNLKHFHHHEQNLQKHYSAPILDYDWVLGLQKSPRKNKSS